MLEDTDRALSKPKKYNIACQPRHLQTIHSQFLFIKVPFAKIVSKHVTIVIKIFRVKQ